MTADPVVVDVRDAFCLHPLPGGAVVALRGLTLAVAPGERVVVHGPNGSGKTTLLRLLAGEQALAAGHATVAGAAVGRGGLAPGWRSRRLGWIDQHSRRMLRPELDVLGNIVAQQRLSRVEPRQAEAAGRDLLERLGVARLASRRPATLSGGEAQRVCVAAALAHGPDLVLADEPTGELDAASALAVYDALAEVVAASGAALVLVSHDRRAARVADRVVRIRDGRLSETWEPGGQERLVVDERGWVRLPGVGATTVQVSTDRESITLRHNGSGVVAAAVPAELARPGEVLIDGDGLGVAYAGREVLRGVRIAVRAGELVVVRGPSGSGKSTLLRVLLGLADPDSGTVELGGTPLAGLDRSGRAALRRRSTGYAGQDVSLAETDSAATNLDLARTARGLPRDDAAADEVLAALDLAWLDDRPVGVLSGGERQRVALARALVVRPQVLVCDEPTSQLDEAGAVLVASALRDVARSGSAVLVASHDDAVVAAADRVVDLV